MNAFFLYTKQHNNCKRLYEENYYFYRIAAHVENILHKDVENVKLQSIAL